MNPRPSAYKAVVLCGLCMLVDVVDSKSALKADGLRFDPRHPHKPQ